jgi:hypothetical protein
MTDRVEAALARLGNTVDTVATELSAGVSDALEAHQGILEEGLESGGPLRPLDPEDLRYEVACADRAFGPLASTMQRLDFGHALDVAWKRFERELDRVVREASAAEGIDPEVYRQLLRYHVEVRVPAVVVPELARRAARLGQWTHFVEQAARGWWKALLSEGPERSDTVELEEVDRGGTSEGFLPEATKALTESLRRITQAEWVPFREALAEAIERADAELEEDLARAAAGKMRIRKRRVPADRMGWSGSEEKWPWESWCRESVSRLQLEIHLVHFRAELYQRGHRHVDQLQEAVDGLRKGIQDAAVWLRSEADRIGAHLADAADVLVELRALTEHDRVCVERIQTEFLSRLRTFSAAPDGPVSTGERLAEAILRLQGSQPESFTVHPLAEADVPDPDGSTVQFEFRRVVSQCFDALLVEKLGRATTPFIETVGQVRAKAETVPSIIESGLMAMREALEAEEGTLEELAAMIPDTLRRAADVTEEVRSELWMGELEQRVCDLMEVGWLMLAPRAVVSSGVGEQLAGLKSDARQAAREAARRVWRRLATEYGRFVARAARGRRFVRGAFRMLEPPAMEDGTPTASPTQELLGRIGTFAQELPLVYRRLFTFGPLREPDLLLGRSEVVTRILVAARAHGERRPLILVAESAAGVSSVFNAVQAGRLQRQVVQVRITERVANSRELIEQFGRARIEVPGENLSGLSEAAKRLLPGDEVPVVLVEGLEHAFTRGAGGQGLVERFLAVMRESASEVVWAASISSSAWQVITVASPHVAAGIDVMAIGPLSRTELEATLWKRHQRSGIPLRFSNPRDPNPILRRKLKRAVSEAARQELLRVEYFDRIYRQTSGSVPLALLLWLDGLSLDEADGIAHLGFPASLSAQFLEVLNLEETFALKAFLEHGTLTSHELKEVLRVTLGDAERILERLVSLSVVEPYQPSDLDGTAALLAVPRMRVRPVAVPIVHHFLKGKNVLHL